MGSYKEISLCPLEDCPIWPFREGDTIKGESKQKAIKKRCENCLNVTIKTSICKEKTCQLYDYRDGHRPVNENVPKRILTQTQIKKFAEQRAKKRKPSSDTLAEAPLNLVKPRRRLIGRAKSD